jgi:ABC-type polysaccharide/polyol phosphate transport system ATPase subunit
MEVGRGEMLALLGRNGAAKSTLLRLIAGVTPPTAGEVEVHGRLFPLLELNAVIHPELTGRENARLLGILAGLGRRVVAERMAAIEQFSDLGSWFERPVRTYSAGMCARLGVAVAMHSGCEILLIDEALTVGDLGFQNACLRRLRELRSLGATVVLASHDLDLVQAVADRAVVLDRGEVRFSGSAHAGVCAYEDLVFTDAYRFARGGVRCEPRCSGRLRRFRVYDRHGRTVDLLPTGTPFGLEFDLTVAAGEACRLSVSWLNVDGIVCVWHVVDVAPEPVGADTDLPIRLWYPENHLVKGAYQAHVRLIARDSFETVETQASAASVQITGAHRARGIARMRAECSVGRPSDHHAPARANVEPTWREE